MVMRRNRAVGTAAALALLAPLVVAAASPGAAAPRSASVSQAVPSSVAPQRAPAALTSTSSARGGTAIRSVTPTRTSVGRTVVITGRGFAHVVRVSIGRTALRFHVDSATRISAQMPARATSGRITVATASVRVTGPQVVVKVPTVTSVSPKAGGLGTVVTLTGSGFLAPATVRFNGVAAAATVVSSKVLKATVPVNASTGKVVVTSAGKPVAAGVFTVTSSLLLSVSVGPPGTVIRVSGAGFAAREAVDLYAGATDLALVTASATGTFSYSDFAIPASAQPGTTWVSAVGRHSAVAVQRPYTVRTNWSTLGFAAGGGRNNPYENTLSPTTVGGLAQAWTYTPGSRVDSSVTVSDGVAYALSLSNGLSALDATTGALRWKFGGAIGGYSTPNVTNGIVYFISLSGTVYAVRASTGAQVWSQSVASGAASSPVVSHGIVYVGSYSTALVALNAATGAVVWTYSTGGGIYSSPVVQDGVVYFGANDSYVYALDAATGLLKWRYLTGGVVEGVPAVVNGVVYIGSDDDKFYALNATTGGLLWVTALAATVYASPAVANGLVYVGASNNLVYALSQVTGGIVWDAVTKDLVGPGVAVADGVVYATNYANQLVALDGSNGTALWSFAAGDTFFFDAPTVVNGTVYVGSSDGQVRAFTLAAGRTQSAAAAPTIRSLHPNPYLRAR